MQPSPEPQLASGRGAELEHAAPTDLPDLTGVPEADRDRVWFERYYQGDQQKQLTLRAVLMGGILGGFMSLSNLYVGLKTGWGLGVAITACILSYAIWQAFLSIGLAKTPMTILENNCMQSTASSAGMSTGGTMVSAIGAFLLITGRNMPFWTLFFWTAFLALLGVCMAVPMKRQMINREQLKFPSGLAAAETLRSLHAAGGEAVVKAKALFYSLGAGMVIKWFIDGMGALAAKGKVAAGLAIPGELALKFRLGNRTGDAFALALPVDPMMMAAGAIVGMRTAVSMAVGAVIVFGVVAPKLDEQNVFAEMKVLDLQAQIRDAEAQLPTAEPARKAVLTKALEGHRAKLEHVRKEGIEPASMIRKWSLWLGSAMMVTAGLTAFAFQWRSIARALGGITAVFRRRKSEDVDPLADLEVPNSWMALGLGLSGLGCIAILQIEWGVAWYWGLLAVLLSFVLSLVACRATGETDITPIGAMGKVTQLFYGVTLPANPVANLMTAGVTAGAATSSADLLTDLKSGYLLGANPRKQFIAQSWGIVAGTLVVVPMWYVLVPDASSIGASSKAFPAPAAEVWASVSKLLSQGLSAMHPTVLTGMVVGAILGVVLTLAEQFSPAVIRKWLPSATGLGLACVINFSDSLAFFIGAVIAWAWQKYNAKQADELLVPVASGIIAGESILGIGIALAQAGGVL
jgi:OPT family oligopeptide transporter